MTPQTSAAQQILSSNIAIEGGQEQVRFLDQHGNLVQLIEVLPEHSQLTIDVRGEVDTRSEDGVFWASQRCYAGFGSIVARHV